MAARGNQVSREKFCCSICLELLKDPVTPTCGHSYCRSCIKDHWDSEQVKGLYSCPQCRKTFITRPKLEKNIMLAELVEELKKTGLVELCEKLQENICPRHDEVMKMFCRTDQQCICYLCSVDEHQGHQIISAAAERSERQKELEETRRKIQQRVQDTEGDVKLLQQEAEAIRSSADGAVEEKDKIFTQMINVLQRRSSEVTQQIRSRQETEERQVQELQKKLEQEIAELKRRDAELEQLAHTQDHKKFLQDYTSLPTLAPSTHRSRTRTRPLRLFEDLTAAVSQVRGQIQAILTKPRTNISRAVAPLDVLLKQPEPETESRADFLKYSLKIKLDPNTAHKHLILSDGNKKVTNLEKELPYRDHPVRFTYWPQVLSRESLMGRCYWEVEWRGNVFVAVSYKNISRTGGSQECIFGFNDISWSLRCSNNCYHFCHNKIQTPLSGSVSSRVGVYLDHSAGVLSFYRVSDTMTLIHRVRTTFTQLLHAGVSVYGSGSSAEFCKPT